jgi:ATP-dependent Clp protease ATP-binding subunit ClpA
MPSFAQSLEKTLHSALSNASERSHEYATLEHLLLALIDDPDAAQVMQACGVDLGDLGEVRAPVPRSGISIAEDAGQGRSAADRRASSA